MDPGVIRRDSVLPQPGHQIAIAAGIVLVGSDLVDEVTGAARVRSPEIALNRPLIPSWEVDVEPGLRSGSGQVTTPNNQAAKSSAPARTAPISTPWQTPFTR